MKTPVSFEFYPPKTDEQRAQLDRTAQRLARFKPDYGSCTFGAGGSTQSHTPRTVRHLREKFGYNIAPHLSCVGGTRDEFRTLIADYLDMGCDRIVTLRGDIPSGMGDPGEFKYAIDLLKFLREEYGDHFHLHVAAYPEIHPQARNAKHDLQNFAAKAKAGATSAITQYFYNVDAYFRFVDDVQKMGVDIPIIAGIMPISDFHKIKQFSAMCGSEIPRWISQRMDAYGEDIEAQRDFATEMVADLCRRLTEGGAPGFHFYTLNLAKPTVRVLDLLD